MRATRAVASSNRFNTVRARQPRRSFSVRALDRGREHRFSTAARQRGSGRGDEAVEACARDRENEARIGAELTCAQRQRRYEARRDRLRAVLQCTR